MAFAGYSYLIEAMSLSVCPLKRSAVVKPVTRISVIGDALAVPASVAPAEGDFLAHILFALKHEGTHLAVLAQALPRIPAESLLNELAKAPNGIYLRKACFLWEHFTALRLDHKIPVRGAPAPLFDPVRYLTGPAVRNPRWRIDFNGLGSLDYCATVERNETIERLLDFDILGRSATFVSSLPPSRHHGPRDQLGLSARNPRLVRNRACRSTSPGIQRCIATGMRPLLWHLPWRWPDRRWKSNCGTKPASCSITTRSWQRSTNATTYAAAICRIWS